ncbi:transposase, partial [Streptomyces sp. NPDC127051]|uniref:transposase n=1 Tax=Streptomyces sp. NPDC127051 TaxID=3347119 RepID=UPI00365A658A
APPETPLTTHSERPTVRTLTHAQLCDHFRFRAPRYEGKHIAAFPQVRLVALTECGTRALPGAAFGVRRVCEQDLARRLLDRMRPGMPVLAGRGFPGWLLRAGAAAGGTHLLWRISAAVLLVPDEVLPDGSPARDPSRAQEHLESPWRGRPRPVRVRVIGMAAVIEAAGDSRRREPCRSLTTLLDHAAFPADELAALYPQRWESEIQFRDLKITQRGPRAVLRSKTPVLASQEIWAYLVTRQAIRRTITATAAGHGLDAARLSFTVALTVARDHPDPHHSTDRCPPRRDDRLAAGEPAPA